MQDQFLEYFIRFGIWPNLADSRVSEIVQRHYSTDVIMSTMVFQITAVTSVYSTVCSGAYQRKHQSFTSLAFLWGIHRWPEMFPFDDVIMKGPFRFSDSTIVACDDNHKYSCIRKEYICLWYFYFYRRLVGVSWQPYMYATKHNGEVFWL